MNCQEKKSKQKFMNTVKVIAVFVVVVLFYIDHELSMEAFRIAKDQDLAFRKKLEFLEKYDIEAVQAVNHYIDKDILSEVSSKKRNKRCFFFYEFFLLYFIVFKLAGGLCHSSSL